MSKPVPSWLKTVFKGLGIVGVVAAPFVSALIYSSELGAAIATELAVLISLFIKPPRLLNAQIPGDDPAKHGKPDVEL